MQSVSMYTAVFTSCNKRPVSRPQNADKTLEQLTGGVSSFPGCLEVIASEVPQRAVLQGVFALKCLGVLSRLEPSGRPLLFPSVPLLSI